MHNLHLKIEEFVRLSWIQTKMTFAMEMTYRFRLLVWVIGDLLQPFVLAIIWSSVANSSTNDLSSNLVISYYMAVIVITRITQDWSVLFVTDSIVYGVFSKYLVKPYHYLTEVFGMSLSIRIVRLVILIPFVILGFYLLRDHLEYQRSSLAIMATIFASGIGYLINFLLGNIFALTAFFVKQVAGLRGIYQNMLLFLTGEYIPLFVLPIELFFLFEILPFRYVLSFPIEILLGNLYTDQVYRGFGISIFWLVALIIVYRIVFRKAIKYYEAEGI